MSTPPVPASERAGEPEATEDPIDEGVTGTADEPKGVSPVAAKASGSGSGKPGSGSGKPSGRGAGRSGQETMPAGRGPGRSGPGSRRSPSPAGSRRGVRYDDQARRPGRNDQPPTVEVRRVRRVVRRIDTWSVFRFAVMLYGCGLVILLTSVVGLWIVASSAGAIPSIEHFITQLFALKTFHFKAGQLFLATFAFGLIWVFAATLFTVILSVLYNLISDVLGGIEMTILEEEPLDQGR
jgi:hypothetical protein